MITSRIFGGLGNQMFQYAMGKALSLRTKQLLRLDTRWFATKYADTTARNYQLSIFANIKEPFGYFSKFYQQNRFLHTYKVFKALGFDYEKIILKTYHEENEDMTDLFLTNEKLTNVFVNGYWQSEKFFYDYRDNIRAAFSFPEFTEREDIQLQNYIQGKNAVSIHVRRGDYITNKPANNLFGGIVDMDYYKTAIKLLSIKQKKLLFIVFSDDITWCRNHLRIPNGTIFVDWHTEKQSFRDMQLMSLCSHHITANSSFSWWGAWLGINRNKIVIAPKHWINGVDSLKEKRCPPNWIRL